MSSTAVPRKKTIMVTDDNQGILDVMRIVLERSGYIAITSHDGRDVLNLKAPLPDLLFLDIMLSGTDGRELCNKLKGNKKTKKKPVLMLSASSEIEEISEACGADGYLSKPFSIKHMIDLVELHTARS